MQGPSHDAAGGRPRPRRRFAWSRLLWNGVGLGLLCYLLWRTPLQQVWAAVSQAGLWLLPILLIPILWKAVFARSLAVLLPSSLGLCSLTRIQVTTDAYSNLLPLAGLGGEPYRLHALARQVELGLASRAVIQDRILHAAAGTIFAALAALATALFVELPEGLSWSLVAGATLMVGAATLLLLVSFSRLPENLGPGVRRLVLRLNIAKLRAPTPTLVRAFGWKMLAQSLKLVEIAAILGALGLPVTPGLILATMAALGISSTAFFVVPQGLGVNEGSVVAAFSALGLGAPQALAVGLIRRGRMLLWSAIGVGIQSLGGPGKSHTRQPEPSWGPRPSERATS